MVIDFDHKELRSNWLFHDSCSCISKNFKRKIQSFCYDESDIQTIEKTLIAQGT